MKVISSFSYRYIMLQLPLKHVTKSVIRALVSSAKPTFSREFHLQTTTTTTAIEEESPSFNTNDVVSSLKDWFKRTTHNLPHNVTLLDRIFHILHTTQDQGNTHLDGALSDLGLHLHESFVLDVLNYGARYHPVLCCLKFFDWAGLQQGFYHTPATFHAIFSILSKAEHWTVIHDYLFRYSQSNYQSSVASFYNVLVMGYAVAGKPYIALQVFAKMRLEGMDLDAFAYHIFLNALVEQSCFEAVDVIAKQIIDWGYENRDTHSIMVKYLCKRDKLDEAEAYLRNLVSNNQLFNGHKVLALLIDSLCIKKDFQKAVGLMDEFRELGLARIGHVYNVWLRNLVQAGKLQGALEFLQEKKSLEGYCPHLFQYNMLVCRLLREKRLKEVHDILSEMNENDITPDTVTMNVTLCFFCKSGMVNVALELYDSRHEFWLSPSSLTCNYLINTLVVDGSIDEADRVLKDSIDHGYILSERTFYNLSEALCREGKLEKMKELIITGLKKNYMPSDLVYDKFIAALCRAGMVEDGYLVRKQLKSLGRATRFDTYINLIHGFKQLCRGDIAARLLIEMQEEGYAVKKRMFRDVIGCLCEMKNPDTRVLELLGIQLKRRDKPDCHIYNFFIDGAAHAKMPELAREIFESMLRNQVEPNSSSDILILQSYLKTNRVSDAMSFFEDIGRRGRTGRKACNAMVVGLCRVKRADIALDFFHKMKNNRILPSSDCYEYLIMLSCANGNYDIAVNVINHLVKDRYPLPSFVGNVLLSHSLKNQKLYEAWVRAFNVESESPLIQMMGQIIGAFCGRLSEHINSWEELIEQCFPLDLYTYNMLLTRLWRNHMVEHACELFKKICEKGYEPNRWSYDIMISGLLRHNRTDEARILSEEMFRRGLKPTL